MQQRSVAFDHNNLFCSIIHFSSFKTYFAVEVLWRTVSYERIRKFRAFLVTFYLTLACQFDITDLIRAILKTIFEMQSVKNTRNVYKHSFNRNRNSCSWGNYCIFLSILWWQFSDSSGTIQIRKGRMDVRHQTFSLFRFHFSLWSLVRSFDILYLDVY